MKNMIKTTKVRTTQWKFSDFDEQEREEAALSSLLRKKKALTPSNVELVIVSPETQARLIKGNVKATRP